MLDVREAGLNPALPRNGMHHALCTLIRVRPETPRTAWSPTLAAPGTSDPSHWEESREGSGGAAKPLSRVSPETGPAPHPPSRARAGPWSLADPPSLRDFMRGGMMGHSRALFTLSLIHI